MLVYPRNQVFQVSKKIKPKLWHFIIKKLLKSLKQLWFVIGIKKFGDYFPSEKIEICACEQDLDFYTYMHVLSIFKR